MWNSLLGLKAQNSIEPKIEKLFEIYEESWYHDITLVDLLSDNKELLDMTSNENETYL